MGPIGRLVAWGVGVAALALVLRLTVLAPRPIAVEVVPVTRGVVEESVTNTRAGTVKARRRARLSPQQGGLVAALPYRKGERVTAGSLLLRLDSSVQEAQLALAREELRSAAARADEACLALELAERELARGKALATDGVASLQLLDTLQSARDRARATCAAARAVLDQAAAQVRLAEKLLALTEVRAPFAGVVADLTTEVGEWITPAPPGVPIPPVLDLLDPSSLYVAAPIDEVDALKVTAGQEVRISVDSLPGERFAGRVTRVAPFVLDLVEQNRTVEVEATFDDEAATARLLPGTSADLEVILERRAEVLRVPTSAVAPGGKVLVLRQGVLREQTVAVGLRNWQFTEMRGGLEEGELVVTVRDAPDIRPGVRAQAKDRP